MASPKFKISLPERPVVAPLSQPPADTAFPGGHPPTRPSRQPQGRPKALVEARPTPDPDPLRVPTHSRSRPTPGPDPLRIPTHSRSRPTPGPDPLRVPAPPRTSPPPEVTGAKLSWTATSPLREVTVHDPA